jgi:hypothetical protein
MSTLLSTNRMSLPPPPESQLSDAGSVVGWVSEAAIGFRGFDDEAEAMAAAWMSHRTLARRRARRDGTRPIPIDVEPLALARDGQREAILAGGRPIATLVRPADSSRSGPDSFGFEIEIPAPRDPARMRAKAFLLYRTLRRSGIRWAMWRSADRGEAPPPARNASRASHAPRAARDGVVETPVRVGPRAPEPSAPDGSAGASMVRRRVAGAIAALGVIAVAVLLPLLTANLVVSALGASAALVALVALAAVVRLVVTDVWSDVREAFGRRARRRRGRAAPDGARPTPSASQPGRHPGAHHAARRGPRRGRPA